MMDRIRKHLTKLKCVMCIRVNKVFLLFHIISVIETFSLCA